MELGFFYRMYTVRGAEGFGGLNLRFKGRLDYNRKTTGCELIQ
jgi:hypothetical protein